MSIFSRLLGIQGKKEVLEDENNPELMKLVDFEKALKELLDKDFYIARSDYKPLCSQYYEIYNQLNTLKKSRTLDFYCSSNHIEIGLTKLTL